MGLFSKPTKGEAGKAAGERTKAIRQGKKGRPLAPSGTVHTARWRYGRKKREGQNDQ